MPVDACSRYRNADQSGLRKAVEVNTEEEEMSTCQKGAVHRDVGGILHIKSYRLIWRRNLDTAQYGVCLRHGSIVKETVRLCKVHRMLGEKLEMCTIWVCSSNCWRLATCVTLVGTLNYLEFKARPTFLKEIREIFLCCKDRGLWNEIVW
jgi:hypothetical protein